MEKNGLSSHATIMTIFFKYLSEVFVALQLPVQHFTMCLALSVI